MKLTKKNLLLNQKKPFNDSGINNVSLGARGHSPRQDALSQGKDYRFHRLNAILQSMFFGLFPRPYLCPLSCPLDPMYLSIFLKIVV